jgi:hypothetical protein
MAARDTGAWQRYFRPNNHAARNARAKVLTDTFNRLAIGRSPRPSSRSLQARATSEVDLSIIAAQRARQINGRRQDPNAQFIAQVLGYTETPYGLIEREWINAQLRAGSQAIQRCRSHKPPQCGCWSASRAILWQARANGEKTPEGWAAVRIYAFLEELEVASMPEIER